MTRDRLKELYTAQCAASLRREHACTASIVAGHKAAETMLAADIETGMAAEIEYQDAFESHSRACDVFIAARRKYMAELGNPVGTNPKGDAALLAAIDRSSSLPARSMSGEAVPVIDEDQT